jgi:hypothetical protein
MAFAAYELVQNAWDSGADEVVVMLDMICDGLARIVVRDNSEKGFINLKDAYTMFAPSTSGKDVTKRGRFNTGEKAVLALCDRAKIVTTTGTLTFDIDTGRERTEECQPRGTTFTADIPMTDVELDEVNEAMQGLIPPVATTYNGVGLISPQMLHKFDVPRLQTEHSGDDGILRRTFRKAEVEVYAAPDGKGELLELGIPVVEAPFGYRVNVLQKVPLNSDRDNVPPGFIDTLQVAVVNEMVDDISDEASREPWVQKAMADSRIKADVFAKGIRKRFGDKAVRAVPGDPQANAAAEAAGYHVIHGGAMAGGAWDNVRKHGTLETTSVVFPGLKPEQLAAQVKGKCPTCGHSLATDG